MKLTRHDCSHDVAELARPWDEINDWYEHWAWEPEPGLKLMLVVGRLEPNKPGGMGTWCGWVEPRCTECGAWNTYARLFPVPCSTCRFLNEPWVPLGSSEEWHSPKRPSDEAERLLARVEANPLKAVIMASDLTGEARKFLWDRVEDLDESAAGLLTVTA